MNPSDNGEPVVVPGIKLTIVFVVGKTVQVRVEPPEALGDKFACYAALEGARDAIKDYNDQQAKQQVMPVHSMPLLRGL